MSELPRVVVTDLHHGSVEVEQQILQGLARVELIEAESEAALQGRLDDVAALMIFHTIPVSRTTIASMRRCKLIVRCGVGYDNVDHAFARQQGVPVANVPDYGTDEVADSAIGLTLALTRGIAFQNTRLRSADTPWKYDHVAPLRRLRGRTFGVVGLGRIGTAVALRAKALGMHVAFYDPYKIDGYDRALGLRRVETIEELLAESYVVSCHCPLTTETRHLINADSLRLMQPGGYLVNTSRGAVVDVAAIPEALASGRLAGAGIDVLPDEPPPADHPLLVAWRDPAHPAHTRLILNAHNAFYSEEGLRDMRSKGAEACRRALLDLPLRNVVN